jgi:hypothetical protein
MGQIPPKIEDLLREWLARLTAAQISHYTIASKYKKVHYCLGIPLFCFSTFITFFLLADMETQPFLKNLVIFLSILSALIASLITFLRPSDLAEKHRSEATKYGSLKRAVETALATEFHSNEEAISFVKDIADHWGKVTADAPVAPRNVFDNTFKKIRMEIEEMTR